MAATLRDVAAHAGVSIRTVSNVVNDFVHVAPGTRERVQASIAALGYRPNLMARSLRQGRTGMLALLVPELVAPSFAELAHHVVDAARPLGWTVLVDQSGGDPARELAALELLSASGRVDGVLFSALGLGGSTLTGFSPQVPVVLLGERHGHSLGGDRRFDHVGIDNVVAARDVVAHLLATGRRRIAAIGNDERMHSPTSELRLAGWRWAHELAGVPADASLVRAADQFSRSAGHAAAGRLLAARPDAIFCLNDQLAIGVLRALREAGVRVPGDIAVAGFDDIDEAAYAYPPLTSVRPDSVDLATKALELLGARVSGDTGPARDVTVGHRVVVRESTLTPSRAAAGGAAHTQGG